MFMGEAQLAQIPSNDGRCYWWRYLMDCAIDGVS